MQDQDAERLAEVLAQCPALARLDLTHLILCDNLIGESGAVSFARNAGAVLNAGLPPSQRQSDRRCLHSLLFAMCFGFEVNKSE